MDPTARRTSNTSGIPRFSRLPVPRSQPKVETPNTLSSIATKRIVKPVTVADRKPPEKDSISERPQTVQALTPRKREAGNGPVASFDDVQEETPKPSLADRTLETLSQIPPTPSPSRRRSSFFQPQTPIEPRSRPASSLARSRPSTSQGFRPPLPPLDSRLRPSSPEKRQLLPSSGNANSYKLPRKSDIGRIGQSTGSWTDSRAPKDVAMPAPASRYRPSSSMGGVSNGTLRGSHITSNPVRSKEAGTLTARTPKPRTSLGGITGAAATTKSARLSSTSTRVSTSMTPSGVSPVARSKRSTPKSVSNEATKPNTASPKSSAAFREQIALARAKAARSKLSSHQTRTARPGAASAWSEVVDGEDNGPTLRARLQIARSSGRLNIAAMNLSSIPQEALRMYDANDGAWYESVDLTRLIAADNKIETLDDDMFPDVSREDAYLNDEVQASIFSGLETLDLHGNLLGSLPIGMRRLQDLKTLNLSRNKLTPGSLSSLQGLNTLKELRLAENPLNGDLDVLMRISPNIEVLDLRKCGISVLTSDITNLTALRQLLIPENQIQDLPIIKLAALPIVELDVSRNHLQGTLLSRSDACFAKLKTLDVSHNRLNSLSAEALSLPNLQSMNIAENKIERLPDLSDCLELVTLTASGNRIAAVPEGLHTLQKLRNVDLSCNDIRKLDERLGLMDGLSVLRVENNPLRERKFLTMNTEDLKSELRSRAVPEEAVGELTNAIGVSLGTAPLPGWKVQGGTVERLLPKIDDLSNSEAESISQDNNVTALMLSQNNFTMIPTALSLLDQTLTSLSLSKNALSGDQVLRLNLRLPKLRALDLSHNALTSLHSLIDHLDAPLLTELSVARNRLRSLPPLRLTFGNLSTINAADNTIENLPAQSIQGLSHVDVTGNEISHLDAKIGLLGDQGLRTLLVGANRFRVPRRDVVDKGTAAILAWLKGRLPADVTEL